VYASIKNITVIGYLFFIILINLGNLSIVINNNTGHKVAYNKKYNSKPPLSLKHP
jgi:putative salt-induced outer membrane protein YdiY